MFGLVQDVRQTLAKHAEMMQAQAEKKKELGAVAEHAGDRL